MICFLNRRHRPYYHQDDEWYLLPQLLDPRVDDLERRTERNADDILRLRRDHEDARMFRREFEADQRAEARRRRDRDDADAEADQARVRVDGRAARRRGNSDIEHEVRFVVRQWEAANEDRNMARNGRYDAIAGAERHLRVLRRDLDRDRL
jgi:hypothetical protein